MSATEVGRLKPGDCVSCVLTSHGQTRTERGTVKARDALLRVETAPGRLELFYADSKCGNIGEAFNGGGYLGAE
jgi:hypothetical protein